MKEKERERERGVVKQKSRRRRRLPKFFFQTFFPGKVFILFFLFFSNSWFGLNNWKAAMDGREEKEGERKKERKRERKS